MPAPMLPITFLTDYGYDDEFAGTCRAVIERLAPGARVVDLTHGIAPGDVRRGALALEQAVGAGPVAVHLAVVDPGVGTERRGVALATRRGDFLVGPDNGLLALAGQRLGGIVAARDVSATPLRLEPTSTTFHGRDVFAPVAAHLAAGRPLAAAGEPLAGEPAELELPVPRVGEGLLAAHVLYADRFGNLVLDARPADLERAGLVAAGTRLALSAPGGEFAATAGSTFADAGEAGDALVVLADSSGRLAVAVNLGSAAEVLAAGRDDEVRIAAAP